MKKIFTLLFTLAAIGAAKAQTQAGSQTLGLNLGYGLHNSFETEHSGFDGSTSVAHTKTSSFSIGPSYSYFVAKNLDLGGSLSYSNSVENDYPINGSFGEKETMNNFSAFIFLRKYLMYANSNKIGLRVGPYLGYGHITTKDISTGDNADPSENFTQKTNTFNAGFNLDVVYYPTPYLGFSATLANLAYSHYKINETPSTDHETGNNIDFNLISNGLSFSVFWTFGRR